MILISLTNAGFDWPNKSRKTTYLVTLDVEPCQTLGLDTILYPFDTKNIGATDLETSLQDIDQLIISGNDRLAVFLSAQIDLSMKAATHLGLACAGLLHWIHVGEDKTISLFIIQDNVQRSVQHYRDCGDQNGILWSSFIADIVDVICQPMDNETAGIQGATLGQQSTASHDLSETATNLCLRLARKLRSGPAHL